jgi:hypothetical protein
MAVKSFQSVAILFSDFPIYMILDWASELAV